MLVLESRILLIIHKPSIFSVVSSSPITSPAKSKDGMDIAFCNRSSNFSLSFIPGTILFKDVFHKSPSLIIDKLSSFLKTFNFLKLSVVRGTLPVLPVSSLNFLICSGVNCDSNIYFFPPSTLA